MINNDEALRRSRHRRQAAAREIPVLNKRMPPAGHTWVLDTWCSETVSPVSHRSTVIHMACVTTSFGRAATAKTNDTECLIVFILKVKLREEALGHRIYKIYTDAASTFTGEGAVERIERETGIEIDAAAGDAHEHAGLIEAMQDQATRMTEAAMRRAKSGSPPAPDGMSVECRVYQCDSVMNRLCSTGRKVSRYQAHTCVAPSERTSPQYLFYTWGSFGTIGYNAPKGTMDETGSSRERTGRVIGMDGRSLLILADDTKRKIRRVPANFDPIGENMLATSTITAGAGVADAAVQCSSQDAPPLTILAPPPIPQPRPKTQVVTEYVLPDSQKPALGDRIEVLWQEPKGDNHRWHTGSVTGVPDQGGQLYEITYEGWSGPDAIVTHDLATDKAKGTHPWRPARSKPPQKGGSKTPSGVIPPSARDLSARPPQPRTPRQPSTTDDKVSSRTRSALKLTHTDVRTGWRPKQRRAHCQRSIRENTRCIDIAVEGALSPPVDRRE